MQTHVLSIDAWRYDDGWNWNQWFSIGYADIPEPVNNRALLALARDRGWLTDASKGRVAVEDDGYNLVVVDKGTREPLIAFCYGEYE